MSEQSKPTVGAAIQERIDRADAAVQNDACALSKSWRDAGCEHGLWNHERKKVPSGHIGQVRYSSRDVKKSHSELQLMRCQSSLESRRANIAMKDALFELMRWLRWNEMSDVSQRIGPIAMHSAESRFTKDEWTEIKADLDEYATMMEGTRLEGSGFPGKVPTRRWLDKLGGNGSLREPAELSTPQLQSEQAHAVAEEPQPLNPQALKPQSQTQTKKSKPQDKPSKQRQDDIITAIQNAKTPLTRLEIRDAMRLKTEGKLGANLAWMVHEGILINVQPEGYWPADRPRPK